MSAANTAEGYADHIAQIAALIADLGNLESSFQRKMEAYRREKETVQATSFINLSAELASAQQDVDADLKKRLHAVNRDAEDLDANAVHVEIEIFRLNCSKWLTKKRCFKRAESLFATLNQLDIDFSDKVEAYRQEKSLGNAGYLKQLEAASSGAQRDIEQRDSSFAEATYGERRELGHSLTQVESEILHISVQILVLKKRRCRQIALNERRRFQALSNETENAKAKIVADQQAEIERQLNFQRIMRETASSTQRHAESPTNMTPQSRTADSAAFDADKYAFGVAVGIFGIFVALAIKRIFFLDNESSLLFKIFLFVLETAGYGIFSVVVFVVCSLLFNFLKKS